MNRTIAAVALAGLFGTFAPAAVSAQTSAPTFSKDVAPILYKTARIAIAPEKSARCR